MAVRVVVRTTAVLAAVLAAAVAGRAILAANGAVRPMWVGPNAVAVAQAQWTRAQSAVGDTEREIGQLEAQTERLAEQANELASWLMSAGGGDGQ